MKIGSLVMLDRNRGNEPIDANQQETIDAITKAGYVFPVVDVIYTVRGFVGDGVGLYLEEVVNPPMHTVMGFIEVGWTVKQFREIQPPMSLDFIEEMQHPLTLLGIEPNLITAQEVNERL